ncbi:MAG TPA: RibD family protein [Acetobacteraceae bacterium]|nr:RibD family protein [Acetobacteraceae bacterium]
MPALLPTALYDPLLATPDAADGCFVLGRLAQSLDGRIATAGGDSHWISGHEDIVHTHRLRALFDAVVVGAGTVRADDPQLTTREVAGRSPVRVVLDTNRRLDAGYRVFGGGPTTFLLCATDAAGPEQLGSAAVIRLPRMGEGLDVHAVRAALAARGLCRVVVEGGGITVSRFLAAGALDRLHVTIAPLLIGSGIPAFTLAPAAVLAQGLRFEWSVHRLGTDLLVDIPIARSRPGAAAS